MPPGQWIMPSVLQHKSFQKKGSESDINSSGDSDSLILIKNIKGKAEAGSCLFNSCSRRADILASIVLSDSPTIRNGFLKEFAYQR